MEKLRAKYLKFICLAPRAYYVLYGNNKRLHNSDSIGLSVDSNYGRFWTTFNYSSANLDILVELFSNSVTISENYIIAHYLHDLTKVEP